MLYLRMPRRSEYGSSQPEGELMDSIFKRYRQASKASKTRILDEVCAATQLNRKYAITRIYRIETSRPGKRQAQ